MKFKNVKKTAAMALALAMCFPGVVSASSAPAFNNKETATFTSSFGVYSPTLTISVPLKLDVRVNPVAPGTGTGVDTLFSIASNSVDIINASVNETLKEDIPVNVTVTATIKAKAAGVVTSYRSFTKSTESAVKKVFLQLQEAGTAAQLTGTSPDFVNGTTHLDLNDWSVTTAAQYTTDDTNKVPITKYGALLSMDMGGVKIKSGSTETDVTADAGEVEPSVKSFAVTGVANTSAEWKSTDLTLEIKYVVKASEARGITPPTVPAVVRQASATTDQTVVVTGVGSATVTGLAIHNDADSKIGDVPFGAAEFKSVTDSTGGSGAGTATITISKDAAIFKNLSTDAYKGVEEELVIGLSDGRVVVTTLKVTN